MLTTDQRAAMRARHAKSTPGQWIDCTAQKGAGEDSWVAVAEYDADLGGPFDGEPVCEMLELNYYAPGHNLTETRNRRANAEFIAHAHQDIPALLDTIEVLEVRLAVADLCLKGIARLAAAAEDDEMGTAGPEVTPDE